MRAIIQFLLGDINIYLPILALVIGLLKMKKPATWQSFSCSSLTWFCFFVIGLYGLHGFVFHTFFSSFTAKVIGWQPSPFQYEVGIANLVFGVLGVLAFIKKSQFVYLPVVVGFFIWFMGDAAGHIYQLYIMKNVAQYNAGSTLYTDIILPILGVVLYVSAYD